MISFVIPTLNEERCLPRLLRSIKSQGAKNFEVIIVDSSSKDRTIEVAKSFGCRVIESAPLGISVSRNIGGKIARGDLIVFIDADVVIKDKFFVEKVIKSDVKIGVAKLKPDYTGATNFLFHIYNSLNGFLIDFLFSFAVFSSAIIVKKNIFKKIRGFNESMHLSEDRDFVLRASKYAKPKLIDTWVSVSTRRIRKWGMVGFLMYHSASHLYYTVFKKSLPLKYKHVR